MILLLFWWLYMDKDDDEFDFLKCKKKSWENEMMGAEHVRINASKKLSKCDCQSHCSPILRDSSTWIFQLFLIFINLVPQFMFHITFNSFR